MVPRNIHLVYKGWVGVGWRRYCETRLSLRELDNQGAVFRIFVVFGGHHGGAVELYHFLCGENLYSAQGG